MESSWLYSLNQNKSKNQKKRTSHLELFIKYKKKY